MLNNSVYKLFNLEGRVALVTGAAGYLGRSMVKILASAGAHVIINGRTESKIVDLARELLKEGYKISTAVFDVTEEEQVKNVFEKIKNENKRLDVIVNNAYYGGGGTISSSYGSEFLASYNVTVVAASNMIKYGEKLLAQTAQLTAGGASVINISSMYGMVSPDPAIYGNSGQNNPPFYGAAKAALIQMTRYTACHLAKARIRVNSISPGPFPNPGVINGNPAFHKELCKKVPMGRTGTADELRGPLLFLASDASSYVTGANLSVDGGWTAW